MDSGKITLGFCWNKEKKGACDLFIIPQSIIDMATAFPLSLTHTHTCRVYLCTLFTTGIEQYLGNSL